MSYGEACVLAQQHGPLLQRVQAWLAARFRGSRVPQDFLLRRDWGPACSPCVSLDGTAGAALMTEFKFSLPLARRPCDRVLKSLLLVAAARLDLVRPSSGAGAVHLGLCPQRHVPQAERLLRRTAERLPLPGDVLRGVLAFCGDFWWCRRGAAGLPRASSRLAAFAVEAASGGGRGRLLRRVFCFPCCCVTFPHSSAAERLWTEWSSDGSCLWIRASSVAALVRLLRSQRRGAALLLPIAGLGEVLI
jgi:hypothetical protein